MKKMIIFSIMLMVMPMLVACGGDDSINETPQKITEEMIAGDFYWIIVDYKIERGNAPFLDSYKIHFKTDRTCRSVLSMENGYRLVDGRIETYYINTNEPMYVYTLISYHGDVIKLKMHGTLDNDLIAEISLAKKPIVIDEPEIHRNTSEN